MPRGIALKNNVVLSLNKAENTVQNQSIIQMVRVMVFNATFIRCSVIVWRSVLLAEEIGVPEKTIDLTNQSIKTIQNLIRYNQRKQTISHIKVSSVSGLSILDYCLRFSLSFFTLLYTDTGINAFFIFRRIYIYILEHSNVKFGLIMLYIMKHHKY
jgi:hypothetical protein